jgi:Transposase DDE domain group 1
VAAVVKLIRKRYHNDVAIILCADSGFFDQKAMTYFEKELKIHYIITGKMYQDVKDDLSKSDEQSYKEIRKNKAVWKYIEISHKLKSWAKFRRCIVTKLYTDERGQFLLDFSRPDTILYTNIGICPDADQRLTSCGGEQYFNADAIIETAHQRGADELIHRSIKELAVKEQLPFEKFGMNRAYYFFLVFTHFLQEAYKNDVCKDVLPISSYPNTFRRVMIDFAAKFTIKSRNLILNVSKSIYDQLNLSKIWNLCHTPIKIQWE